MKQQARDLPRETTERILQAVQSLEYGSVEIVVHDSRVVQIERRERVRLAQADSPARLRSAAEPSSEPLAAGTKTDSR